MARRGARPRDLGATRWSDPLREFDAERQWAEAGRDSPKSEFLVFDFSLDSGCIVDIFAIFFLDLVGLVVMHLWLKFYVDQSNIERVIWS